MTVTPNDYKLVERPILLDRPTVESLPNKKLHCIERVQISPDLDPRTLDNSIVALKCTDYVFCPTELLEVLYRKCKWHETRVLDFSGELWIIDDIRELPVFGIQALDGVATLVVFGELTIDPAITPQMLTEKLFKVHNLNLILCSPEQKSALEAKLGIKIGEILNPLELDDEFH
jgi:hypothetical protein